MTHHLLYTFDDTQPQVCCAGPNNDWTLCGIATDTAPGVLSIKATNRKITCEQCADIIRHCWQVQESEVAPTR